MIYRITDKKSFKEDNLKLNDAPRERRVGRQGAGPRAVG